MFLKTAVTCTLLFLGVGYKAWSKYSTYLRKKKRLQRSLKKPGVVILHQFPRGMTLPNISPFPLKLETYLRLAKIPYENDFGDFMSPKGKCPYITLNGEDISDSQLILEHLNKKFDINLNKELSETEIAIGHAFRIMAENHLYWELVLYRYVYDQVKCLRKVYRAPFILSCALRFFVPRRIKKAAYMQGIGRHSEAEVKNMTHQDLLQLSHFLGEKKFFFGDQPTEFDCSLFGIIAQVMWTLPGTTLETFLNNECANLSEYCLRMKTEVWPDWNQCLYPKK